MPKRRESTSGLNRPLQSQSETRAAAAQIAQSQSAPQRSTPPREPQPTATARPTVQGGAGAQGGDSAGTRGDRPEAPPAERPRVQRRVEFDDDELDVPDFLK